MDKHLNETTAIIADPITGNQKRVNFDRLKKFNNIDFIKYNEYIKVNDEYLNYRKGLMETLKEKKVKYRDQKLELDYTKRLKALQRKKREKNKKRK